jgi:hypothetical protein
MKPMKLLNPAVDSPTEETQRLGKAAPGVKANRMTNKPRPLPLRWDEIEEVFKGWRQYAAADKKMNDMWNSLLEDLRTHAESKRLISAAT